MSDISFASLANFQPKQLEAHEILKRPDCKYLLYGGAVHGGKSYFLRWEALYLALYYARKYQKPHIPIGLFSEDYPTLRDRQISRIEHEFPKWIGDLKETQESGLGFYLKPRFGSGAILLRNLDDPSKYSCYSPDTEILTEQGFKLVSSVKVGDQCLSLDPKTREMLWRPVTKIYQYDFDGELVQSYSRFGVSYSVTPNHKMIYRTKRKKELRLSEARNMPADVFFPRKGWWQGVRPESHDIIFQSDGNNGKVIRINRSDYLYFMGLYLAEGSCDPKRWAIRISQHHGKNHRTISALLNRMRVNWHYNGKEYSFNNKSLAMNLLSYGKAVNKFIDPKIKNYSSKYLQSIWRGLMIGDGHRVSKRKYIYTTISKQLADDVTEVGLKLGFVTTLYVYPNLRKKYPNGKFYTQKISYHLTCTQRNDETRQGRRETRYYKGKVFCLTIEPHHTVLIRHRGRIMFCGQSVEFAAILIEELTRNQRSTFDDLRTRLRYPEIVDRKFVGATNPGEVGHGWVKKLWVTPDFLNPDLEQKQFFFVKALYSDNKYSTPDYIQQLEAITDPQKRKALLEGNWDVFKGQYFSEFDSSRHVVKPIQPKLGELIFGGMDWGRTAPFAFLASVLLEMKFEGKRFNRIITFYEAYGVNQTPQEWAKRIKRELADFGLGLSQFRSIRADPSMFTKGADNSLSIADQFQREGLHLLPASNDRVGGWVVVHNWLSLAPDGEPYWQITENCKNLIRTLPELIYDNNRPEDVDSSGEDHAPDCARYFLKHLKWIDAKLGFVPETTGRLVTARPAYRSKIDLTAFEENRPPVRDWKLR